MSSQRAQSQLASITEKLRHLGQYSVDYRSAIRWQGRVDASNTALAGRDAILIDFTSQTWNDQNLRATVICQPVSDLANNAALKTQSHAAGHYIDGSYSFQVYMETPETWVNDLAAFQRNVIQHLRGQLGAPVQLFLCDAETEPTVQGVNGAVASATYVSSEMMIPSGNAPVGGV